MTFRVLVKILKDFAEEDLAYCKANPKDIPFIRWKRGRASGFQQAAQLIEDILNEQQLDDEDNEEEEKTEEAQNV